MQDKRINHRDATASWRVRVRLGHQPALLAVLAAVVLLMWALNPHGFMTARNFQAMAFQLPELGLLSLAMMIVMLSGGIDLTVVATSNLAGIVAALAMRQWVGSEAGGCETLVCTACAVGAGLLVAALVGAANGCLVASCRVPPVLATLGMMTLVRGIGLVCTGGRAVSGLPGSITTVGHGSFCGVPVPLWIFAACALAVFVMLEHTTWGFKLYMLGANPVAAVFSGVHRPRALIRTYILSGLLCGMAGIIMVSRFNSAKAGYGESYLLVTILAAVLGGTSAYGGFGRVSGLLPALMILQVISSGLNLLRVSSFLTNAIWGMTILLVLGLSLAGRRWELRRATRPEQAAARRQSKPAGKVEDGNDG